MLNRNIAPTQNPITDFTFRAPDKVFLENGTPCWLLSGGGLEIAHFEIIVKAGSYNQQKPLQALLATHHIKSGTIKKSSAEISYKFDFYGVSLQLEAQKDFISLSFYALKRHLYDVLHLFVELFTEPVYPQHELDIYLLNRKQKHIINQKKVQHLARVHFANLLFGDDHPYGLLLKTQDFDSISRDEVLSYFHQFFTGSNISIFVSGELPENIVTILNHTFGRIPAEVADNPSTLLRELPPFHPVIKEIEMEGAPQASIRVGKPIIDKSHPDFHMLAITNTLLGGFFGSRLMLNIRQQKGYTYGINSAMVSLLRAGYFFISSQVGKQVAGLAMDEIIREIDLLCNLPPDNSEVELVRNYLTAALLRSFDGPFMQMERFKEILLFDLSTDWYNQYLSTLNLLNPDNITAMARMHLRSDSMTKLVVG